MTRPDTRRAKIVERLADHVLVHGVSALSLRSLAKQWDELLHYLADEAEMMTATLGVIAMRIMVAMEM